MFVIYDFIFIVLGLFFFPYYILKKRSLKDILARIKCFIPDPVGFNRPIWIHAVSVGEILAIRPLIKKLKECFPHKEIVITTVTSTGRDIAQKIKEKKEVFYLPFDLSFLVRPLVKKINPSVFLLTETELWPNLISALEENNTPIILVNGRLSPRSFRGYSIFKGAFSCLLNKIDLFLVQTQMDQERFIKLGAEKDRIKVVGNLKFDMLPEFSFNNDIEILRQNLGLKNNEKLLLAGSTHPKEEELVMKVYCKLKTSFPHLRLLIAPRHPHRSIEIKKIIKKFGCKGIFLSSLDKKDNKVEAVFILDFIGRLLDFYLLADIVFVGGSLVKKGGHNILEPAFFKKPIIFGPYMFNFQEISDQFLKENAAVMVFGTDDFYKTVKELLTDSSLAIKLGENAYNLIRKNQGVTERHLKWISSIFSGT